MGLNTEILLTLQCLKGCGNKITLFIAKYAIENNYIIDNIDKLCSFWENLKIKRLPKSSEYDLIEANRYANRIIQESEQEGIGILSYFDAKYPKILKECINKDGKNVPPIILYYRGNINALEKPGIAIIGTREPTSHGISAGKYFSKKLAKLDFNIISGLAIGCDSCGHEGALDANGTTTTFLANGLDWNSIYPKENLELAKRIVAGNGLLLSEYPVGQNCNRYSLIARDRLQAGLSYATVVIQTGIKGGTMNAVNATIKAKKPLFMIAYNKPEDYNNDKVQGNNFLINEHKAYALTSKNFEKSVSIIKDEINKSFSPKIKDTLF